MSCSKRNPPRLAIWLLLHVCPGADNDALAGDLVESFREGRTRAWLWRQVLIAVAVGAAGEIRRRGPHLCYAMVGTAMPALLLRSVDRAGLLLHWWAMPWPWSQLALEVTPSALCALAALPALGAALAIHRTFRWVSLIRTGVINLVLITLGYYLFGWLRSMLAAPRSSQLNDTFLLTLACLQLFFSFSTFLVAASLGCLPPRANCRA